LFAPGTQEVGIQEEKYRPVVPPEKDEFKTCCLFNPLSDAAVVLLVNTELVIFTNLSVLIPVVLSVKIPSFM